MPKRVTRRSTSAAAAPAAALPETKDKSKETPAVPPLSEAAPSRAKRNNSGTPKEAKESKRAGQEDFEVREYRQINSSNFANVEMHVPQGSLALLTISIDGLVKEWNDVCEDISGYLAKDIVGKHYSEVLPNMVDEIGKIIGQAKAGKKISNLEASLPTRDGKNDNVLLMTSTKNKEEKGQPASLTLYGQDITKRRKAEIDITRAANDLRALLDTANAPILGVDKMGMINEWNLKTAEIVGFSQAEVMGRSLVEEFITPEYRTAVKEVLDKALAGRETANFEFPLFTKDKKCVDMLLNATSHRDAQGQIVGVVGVGQDITERKRAEGELTRVANDLRSLIDNANAPIFGIDEKGLVNEWNRKAAEIVGYTSHEVMGRNLVEDFISPEFKVAVQKVLDNALLGTETANFEFPLFTKTQERVEVLLNATTRRDAQGKIVGVVGVGQDITERKLAEGELTRVAGDLRGLIDNANAPIFGIDENGLVNEWNRKAAEIVGYTSEEVMGKNLVGDFITQEFKAPVKEVLDNALLGKETANFEFPLFTNTQERVEVLLNATTRRDAQGKIVGVVGVGQDITERKRAEGELTRVANDLRGLIDNANAPIFGIDENGLVNEWNRKAAEIVGYTSKEVMGRNLVEDFISPEFRVAVQKVLDNALKGIETANFEFPLFTNTQERVEVLLNATTRRDAQGKIVGVVGVGQDITERKLAEGELTRVAGDLRALIDNANAPIFGIDKNGLVNEWNRKAAEIVGYTADEVMKRNLVEEFISPDFRVVVQKVLDNALKGVETANFEFPLFTKTQERVEVLLNATSRRDAQGKIVGVVGVGQDITERKLAEGELSRVAGDLRGLIDNANAPIFGIDENGLVNEWNRKAAEIVGYSQFEVMGRNLVEDFISPDYKVLVTEVLDNALKGTETANFEFPLFTKTQERVEVLLNATTRRDAQGKIVGVVGVGQDITERKRAEGELSRVANDLRGLIDNANAPIFGIDENGLVNEWNRKAAEIIGYTADESMGTNLVEVFISPEFRVAVQKVLDNALQGIETANFEFPLFTKNQERVEVLLNATTRRDAQGKIVGVVGVGQDITERKRAEGELTRVANDLRALIDNANAPIFGIDENGLVNEWNRKAAEIVGYNAEEVMGKNLVRDFITKEFKVPVKEVLDNALQGTETANFEFPLFTKTQERVEVLLNATTRRDAQGKIVGVVGVGQDITERKRAEGELTRVANDLRGLIDNANAPIFGIDKNGLVNEWNRKAAEIVGYTSEEVMGQDLVEEFISPDFRVVVQKVLDNALLGIETANFEFPLFTKTQERVEVLLNATTRRDAQGKIVGVVGVGQDITERKLAEGELSRVAGDLRALIDNANAPIFGIDENGLVNEWNRKAAEIVGYTSEEVMGKNLVDDFITQEFKAPVKEVLDNALKGKETANFEFPLFTNTQERVEVLLNATTRRDAQGKIVGVVGVGQDITERKRAEGELSRVANDLRGLIDNANAPIFGIDENGLVNEWNRKAAEIVGYTSEEVMGRNLVGTFITQEFKAPVKEVLDNALKGTETANFEFPLFTKTQERVEVLLNATTRRDAQGKIVGVVGVGQDITERKRAEGELSRVANDLRGLIDNANAPIFGIDENGLVNEWNRKAAEIVGYSQFEVMGRNLVEDFISPDYKVLVTEVLDNALKGTETANFEFPLFTKTQERVEVLLNATTRRDAQGKIVGVVGVGQDITERKRAEGELTRVANDLRALIDNANAPIFGIDENGLVNEWNRKAAEIVGYTSEEVMGKNLVDDFITQEFKAPVKEVLDNALLGKETANFEFPLFTNTQERVEVLLNATTRRDAQGKIVGVVGVGQDITERKRAEGELTRVANDLRGLIDNANAPIFGIDENGLVNEWNRKAAEIVGYTQTEVMGKNLVGDFITLEFKEAVKEVLDNALKGQQTANFEFPLFTKTQERVDVLLNATTRRDAQGNIVGVVGVGQDITERKRAEGELTRVANDLRALIDNANAPIFGIDENGLVNEWNRKAAEIVGYTQTEVMGKNLVGDFITLEFKEAVKEVLDNALKGQQTANFEFPLFTKTQERVDVLLNATTRRDAQGNIVGVVGVGQDITERKRAEGELTRVANDLRSLIDNANAPIFGIDENGLVNEWNRKAAEIVGYTSKEVMGRNLVKEFISPDFSVVVQKVLDNALRGIETANFEFPLFTKTQERVEVLLNATSRRDAQGKIVGVVGVGQDITERKLAEGELTRVAGDLRALIDNANAPIFGIDSKGLVNEWNRKAAEIVGYSQFEVMGRNLVEDFISPEYKVLVNEVLDNALKGTETANFEFPLFTKTQERVEVLLNATTRRDAQGKIVGVVGVGQDITDRKRAEGELQHLARDLRSLIDNANAPIFGIDENGLLNEWNRKAAEIVGYSQKEVMGRNLVDEFITSEYKSQVKEVLDRALQGIESSSFEFPLFSKTGKRIELLLNASSRRDNNGRIVGVVGVGQDITEKLRAFDAEVQLRKAEAANDAKSQFLANMSHEMRTPLNGIIGVTQLLLETELDAEQKELTELIKTSADSLLSVINDILDLTRVESGKLELEFVDFDVRQTVEEALDSVIMAASSKGLEMVSLVDPNCPQRVRGDSDRLKQVLLNLLSNAVKFTQTGEVVVSLEVENELPTHYTIKFSVRDSGIGIPLEAQGKLFTRFTQVDSSTTRVYGGTGLGLAISKQLVDLMNGSMGVFSEPGKGSVFYFNAMLERASTEPPKEKLLAECVERLSPILIVAPNRYVAKSLSQSSRMWGLEVVETPSIESAKRLILDVAPHEPQFKSMIVSVTHKSANDQNDALISFRNEFAPIVKHWVVVCPIFAVGKLGKIEEEWSVLSRPVRLRALFDCLTDVARGTLPRDRHIGAPAARTHMDKQAARHATRILLVEDNSISQQSIRRMLLNANYTCDVAGNGEEALQAMERINYHVVLMDLYMPVKDGLATAIAIRDMEKSSDTHVPIIGISANEEDHEKCFRAGMDAYIPKPIEEDALLTKIHKLTAGGGAGEAEELYHNKLVLLAEDTPANQMATKRLMEKQGVRIHVVENGGDAVKLMEKTNYDFILMDLHMPIMDGVTATKEIRRMKSPYGEVPVIGLTADLTENERMLADDAGFTEIILKPLSIDTCRRLLSSYSHCSTVQIAKAGSKQKAPAKHRGGRKLRLLVVEDDITSQKMIRRLVEREGMDVSVADNGAEAVKVTSSEQFDLVLMDCNMPVMDGWQATKEIRERELTDPTGRHIPIVAVTANAMRGDREKCLESGMDDYLTKPVQKKPLLLMVHKWANSPSYEDPQDEAETSRGQGQIHRGPHGDPPFRTSSEAGTLWSLPAVEEDAERGRSKASTAMPKDQSKSKPKPSGASSTTAWVLVIVDDGRVRERLKLDMLRFKISLTVEYQDAIKTSLDSFRSSPDCSLILIDSRMLYKDGLNVTSEIRNAEMHARRGRRTPIVAFSSEMDLSDPNTPTGPTLQMRKGQTLRYYDIGLSDNDPKLVEEQPLDAVLLKWLPNAVFSSKNRAMLKGKKVLYAEDSLTSKQIVKRILEKEGLICSTAENGKEAVDMVRQEHFDCILMDCDMPIMDGWQATREIQKFQGHRTPIIAVTANSMKGDRQKCHSSGMDDYMWVAPHAEDVGIMEGITTSGKRAHGDSVKSSPSLSSISTVAGQNSVKRARRDRGASGSGDDSSEHSGVFMAESEDSIRERLDLPRRPLAAGVQLHCPIDIAQALERTGNDWSFLMELLASLVTDGLLQTENMQRALRDDNIELLAFEGHSMKGASSVCCALALHNATCTLGKLCRQEGTTVAERSEVVADIIVQLEQLTGFVQALNNTAMLDIGTIITACGGQWSMAKRYVEDFAQRAPDLCNTMRALAAVSKFRSMRATLSSLKGAAKFVAAGNVEGMCDELQTKIDELGLTDDAGETPKSVAAEEETRLVVIENIEYLQQAVKGMSAFLETLCLDPAPNNAPLN